jgi:hypothetical protein
MVSSHQQTSLQRLVNGVRQRLNMRVLPPRRVSREEREAFEDAVMRDPEIERAFRRLVEERPQFGRRDPADAGAQTHPRR